VARRPALNRRPALYRPAQGEEVDSFRQVVDAVDRIGLIAETGFGNIVAEQRGTYFARPRDIVPVDANGGRAVIMLPAIDGSVVGKTVSVVEVCGSSEDVTIVAAKGDSICGADSLVIDIPYSWMMLFAIKYGLWVG
jgi:hypothetical protein